ncbi:MAG: excinuclease ABC subunit UvrC [Pseudomonadota bacterium]|nr:excinuclease ABC subunit UvrC [Pseudomonadota bacterium]
MPDLQTKISKVPQLPGVYLFKRDKLVIYVGKAKNLRNRVRQYFNENSNNLKTTQLVSLANDLDFIVTETEHEALLLECDLIKRYSPKYNILLKDGKGYPYIKISREDTFPGIYYFRGKVDTSNDYFGPYTNLKSLREALEKIQKIFKIRTCSNSYFSNRTRPCMLYQIKRCSGPCVGKISESDYLKSVKSVELFLQNKSDQIIAELNKNMEQHVNALEYEQAAIIRDQIFSLRQLQKKQEIKAVDGNYDVFHFTFNLPVVKCYYLAVRNGKVFENKNFIWQEILASDNDDIVTSLLVQFYARRPKQSISHLITNCKLKIKIDLEKIIAKYVGNRISIVSQPKSDKAQWLKMAAQNSEFSTDIGLYNATLQNLATLLNLNEIPSHIECFDISHTSGTNAIASCVVFKNGFPDKKSYRHLKVQPKIPGDDYEALGMAVRKRYDKKIAQGQELPNLIIIDGGRGQLNTAVAVLDKIQMSSLVDIISISKGDGRVEGLETIHYGESKAIPVNLDKEHFKLLLKVRNEAHKHALKKHTKARTKSSLKSCLQEIPQVGPKKRKLLLNHFANINDIKNCSVNDLAKIDGINKKIAANIKNFFNDN